MFRTLIISAVFLMFLSQSMTAWDGDGQIMQETVTLKSQMELIHERFGVNFVYDASLELDRMTLPAPLVISDSDRASLELCLQTLFGRYRSRVPDYEEVCSSDKVGGPQNQRL